LATRGKVAAGTQNPALSARLFLYREVLSVELPWAETGTRVPWALDLLCFRG
jgi:hypothetical protein